MKQTIRSFVGMDVHKATIAISVAEDGRSGPVRFIGAIPNTPEAVGKMAKQLGKHGELDFCYEASGCGYGIHRQLTGLGHKCTVAAPSMIPRKPGERIKTDRRDSEKLAILHRSDDLTPVWVPDTTRSASRFGSGESRRIHAPDAGSTAAARLPAAAWPQLSDRQSLDAAPSLLAGRADLSGAGPRYRLSGLSGDRFDCAG